MTATDPLPPAVRAYVDDRFAGETILSVTWEAPVLRVELPTHFVRITHNPDALRPQLARVAEEMLRSAAAPQTEHDRQMLAGEAQRLGSLAEVQS